MNTEILKAHGVDCDAGIKCCLNDSAFFESLLLMFLEDSCFDRARAAICSNDLGELFNSLHELKGVSGNVALTDLYGAICAILPLLRSGSADGAEIARLFAVVSDEYRRVCEGIREAVK